VLAVLNFFQQLIENYHATCPSNEVVYVLHVTKKGGHVINTEKPYIYFKTLK